MAISELTEKDLVEAANIYFLTANTQVPSANISADEALGQLHANFFFKKYNVFISKDIQTGRANGILIFQKKGMETPPGIRPNRERIGMELFGMGRMERMGTEGMEKNEIEKEQIETSNTKKDGTEKEEIEKERTKTSGQAELDIFFIGTYPQGIGVGRQLLKTLGDYAIDHSVRSINTSVSTADPRALSFYSLCGFQTVTEIPLPGFSGFAKQEISISPDQLSRL